MNDPSDQTMRDTSRLIDITGPENTLILLAAPGDEVSACGGFIAEACGRGRPPFVAILGDGAPDGAAGTARRRERASRAACRRLGLPADRLLLVGLGQGNFPAAGTPLFQALRAAMAEVSWRRDCNVILAPFPAPPGDDADAAVAWRLADALARAIEVPLLAAFRHAAPAGVHAKPLWRLDARRWNGRTEEAGLAHDDQPRGTGYEAYGRIC